jgi:hypothetical protein
MIGCDHIDARITGAGDARKEVKFTKSLTGTHTARARPYHHVSPHDGNLLELLKL